MTPRQNKLLQEIIETKKKLGPDPTLPWKQQPGRYWYLSIEDQKAINFRINVWEDLLTVINYLKDEIDNLEEQVVDLKIENRNLQAGFELESL